LLSARNIRSGLDRAGYSVSVIGIARDGTFTYLGEGPDFLVHPEDPAAVALREEGAVPLACLPGAGRQSLIRPDGNGPLELDLIFPALHGPFGEDGSVQGFLEVLGLPSVGAGVLGSAAGMDKEFTKRLLREAGLPVADFLAFRTPAAALDMGYAGVRDRFGPTVFVKPASQGSSIGVSKVSDAAGYAKAVAEAFAHDGKILVEEFVKGREIECAVLGNADAAAAPPGEIVPLGDFYDYRSKYLDARASRLDIPARLEPAQAETARKLAVRAFHALGCRDLARVDFFLREDGKFLVNEINTLPGFTNGSMYPKLWEAAGVPLPDLLDRLVRYALGRTMP
jgi:D-alanine-D-alanine ligase